MKKCKTKTGSRKSQVVVGSPRELIRRTLRGQLHEAMVGLVYDMFDQEVEALCGLRYQRDRECEAARAGSEQGSIYWDGRRQPVRRPRVRAGGYVCTCGEIGSISHETTQAVGRAPEKGVDRRTNGMVKRSLAVGTAPARPKQVRLCHPNVSQ